MNQAARVVILAYAVATAVAVAVAVFFSDRHPLFIIAAADVAATCVIFAFSMRHNNSSFYDPYWSVIPPVVAVYLALLPEAIGASSLRTALVVTLVSAWAIRLTYNWWRGWTGLDHEDWRYVNIRNKSGSAYPLASFAGIHMFPTVIVFAGMVPLWPALVTGTQPFGLLDIAAVVVTGGAIAIEAIADSQLSEFRRSSAPKGTILQTGLWKYSRHPNYFGEASFWWGLFLFGLAAGDTNVAWSGAGALAITIMFWFVSIPLLDNRSLERREGYAAHMATVSSFIPLPRKS
ncbi:MAG: steroid 5-alpha reductase family enzyme [Hyphomicrobiaceae bacterium]|jgi:steroid 5-alpha reductase family enzyme